jgi:uncharacterized membrane protein
MAASRKAPRSALPQALKTHLLLIVALVVAIVIAGIAAMTLRLSQALLIGWDAGVALYLALVLRKITGASAASIRQRAEELDESKWGVLAVTVGACIVSVIALGAELLASKDAPDAGLRAPLAIFSLALSWLFVHTVFGLFYAHEWHRGDKALDFPSTKEPDYFDFMYFSFVIGMTFQVSDVQTRSSGMRRVVLVHGMISFAFSALILAMGVNLTASMF